MCKKVASNTLELPYYKGIGRQRGRGFGALAQVIGRTAIPFLKKYIVPAAKRVSADLLEFAVPEVAAQKFKILLEKEKRTVRGSPLVNLSDTKQGFTVPRRKQRCMETGHCNI